MADPKALYQEVILDHNRKPRNYGALEHASHHAEGHNPLCGDHISVSLDFDGERIGGIAFQGESCAICKASASMMTVNVKGKTRADAETLIQEFRDMATGKLDLSTALTTSDGSRYSPACATCRPASSARSCRGTRCTRRSTAVASTSTEAEDDPMHASIGDA